MTFGGVAGLLVLGISVGISAGCESDEASGNGAGGASGGASPGGGSGGSVVGTGGTGGTPAPTCSAMDSCTFATPAMWQMPIDDYLVDAEAAGFNLNILQRSIDDLLVYKDRLYFGYGDATLNVGSEVPIEIRYWDDPDAAPVAENVVTGEEVISHYRRYDDLLLVPGVDAADDNWIGNMLVKQGDQDFVMHRSIPAGVHVQDVAMWNGAMYACGSGALDLETWNTGVVRSWLWKSTDMGATWDALFEVPNETPGDRRWIQMMPFADKLSLFGYRTNEQGSLAALTHVDFDGVDLTPSMVGGENFVFGSEPFGDKALLHGVYVGGAPYFQTLVSDSGAPGEPLAAMVGRTVLDISVGPDGTALFMALEGDGYPMPDDPPDGPAGDVTIYATTDLQSFQALATFHPTTWPTSVAYWRGSIYVGMNDGEVWRGVGAPTTP